MMTATIPSSITLADFLQQEETKPASEYINGKIEQKTMPQGQHSLLQWSLTTAINQVLMPSKIGYALPEIRCTFGGTSLVPDIGVFQAARIPRQSNNRIGNRFEIAPDWVIEILSPQQRQTKVIRKIVHCLNNGSQLGWLIDPEEDLVIVLFPQENIRICDGSDMELPLPQFIRDMDIEFKLTVGDLFSYLTQ